MWSDILTIIIVLISVFVFAGRIDSGLPSLLKLPPDFGAAPDEFREYSVETQEEASDVSKEVIDFCRARNIDRRKAFWVGLCIEELAVNTLRHGFFKRGQNSINIRVVCKRDQYVDHEIIKQKAAFAEQKGILIRHRSVGVKRCAEGIT